MGQARVANSRYWYILRSARKVHQVICIYALLCLADTRFKSRGQFRQTQREWTISGTGFLIILCNNTTRGSGSLLSWNYKDFNKFILSFKVSYLPQIIRVHVNVSTTAFYECTSVLRPYIPVCIFFHSSVTNVRSKRMVSVLFFIFWNISQSRPLLP